MRNGHVTVIHHVMRCLFSNVTGEVLAENWMPVKAGADRQHLSGAIAARIREAGHTILECYGSTAVTTAIQVSPQKAALQTVC